MTNLWRCYICDNYGTETGGIQSQLSVLISMGTTDYLTWKLKFVMNGNSQVCFRERGRLENETAQYLFLRKKRTGFSEKRRHVKDIALGGSVMSDPLRSHGVQPTRLFCLWNFSGKITGVGCHYRLQRVFLTQGSNISYVSFIGRQIFFITSAACWRGKWQPSPVFLPGGSRGQWRLVGCCLCGRTESDTTEAT